MALRPPQSVLQEASSRRIYSNASDTDNDEDDEVDRHDLREEQFRRVQQEKQDFWDEQLRLVQQEDDDWRALEA
jgi:hypothetical protein